MNVILLNSTVHILGWLSFDRKLDSLLSVTPFNIVYLSVITVFEPVFDVNKYTT